MWRCPFLGPGQHTRPLLSFAFSDCQQPRHRPPHRLLPCCLLQPPADTKDSIVSTLQCCPSRSWCTLFAALSSRYPATAAALSFLHHCFCWHSRMVPHRHCRAHYSVSILHFRHTACFNSCSTRPISVAPRPLLRTIITRSPVCLCAASHHVIVSSAAKLFRAHSDASFSPFTLHLTALEPILATLSQMFYQRAPPPLFSLLLQKPFCVPNTSLAMPLITGQLFSHHSASQCFRG